MSYVFQLYTKCFHVWLYPNRLDFILKSINKIAVKIVNLKSHEIMRIPINNSRKFLLKNPKESQKCPKFLFFSSKMLQSGMQTALQNMKQGHLDF